MDKVVQVYDRTTSKIVSSLKGHTKKVTAVLASPLLTPESLPTFLVSSSLDKSVRVWTPNGNKTVYGAAGTLSTGGEVNALSLHPSNSLFASASSDGTWSIHDLTTTKPSTLLTVSLPVDAEQGTALTAISFHPDGAILAVGSSDSLVRVFDTVSGACVATFPGHSEGGGGAITSLAFSENGYTLATAAEKSGQVKIWDLRKLVNSHSIDLPSDYVVRALAWDQSAQFLAVAGTGLRVYLNKTWEEILVREENGEELSGVGWVEGEVVVAGLDRAVRFVGVGKEE